MYLLSQNELIVPFLNSTLEVTTIDANFHEHLSLLIFSQFCSWKISEILNARFFCTLQERVLGFAEYLRFSFDAFALLQYVQ